MVQPRERALLIGIQRPHMKASEAEASLTELARLVDTAGGEVAEVREYKVKPINPATFIGRGRAYAIAESIREIDFAVLDDDLTPAQNNNLVDILGIKVLDRTAIILDIFAKRAKTKEGKLQVELAQLEYRLPRLVGKGLALSQQAGHIGNRGPGETKLEVARRRIREKITDLKTKLGDLRRHRTIQRAARSDIPVISLVGYTNAGKSTLMNTLTGANLFVEDKLFATLDPTVRMLKLPSGRRVLIADTVGFISRLPHQLIEAFKATLEELGFSRLLLHVIDAADPEIERQTEVVEDVLTELGLDKKPVLRVYNKCDLVGQFKRAISVSALNGTGIKQLLEEIDSMLGADLSYVRLRIPYSEAGLLSELYQHGQVLKVKHNARSITVEARVTEGMLGKLQSRAKTLLTF